MITITYKELYENLVYVENYYDIPLSGLCTHKNQLVGFKVVDSEEDDPTYEIIHLTPIQKIRELVKKKLFEICVGKHWSYKNGKRLGDFEGFTTLTKIYFWCRK